VKEFAEYITAMEMVVDADDPCLRWVALEMLKKGVGMYGSCGLTAERREQLKLFHLDS